MRCSSVLSCYLIKDSWANVWCILVWFGASWYADWQMPTTSTQWEEVPKASTWEIRKQVLLIFRSCRSWWIWQMRWRKREKYTSRWHFQSYAILLSSLPGLLHAGVEKVQGGGRGGVHQGYVQSRWPTRKKEKNVLIRWFSVHVWHRPPSRWLQGEKIQGVLELRLMLPLVWNSLILL